VRPTGSTWLLLLVGHEPARALGWYLRLCSRQG